MKKVSGYVSVRALGCYDFEFFVEDNTSDEEIEKMVEAKMELSHSYEVEEGYEEIHEVSYRKKDDTNNSQNSCNIPKELKEIPHAIHEASFHGETWYKCPNCNKGVEEYSWKPTNRREIKICPFCKNKAVVGYYGMYFE